MSNIASHLRPLAKNQGFKVQIIQPEKNNFGEKNPLFTVFMFKKKCMESE